MQPQHVGMVVAGLMCFTLPCYFFMIPDNLITNQGKQGHWGPPNAEFNWCELDYVTSEYVAEPFNTFTSVLYLISAALGIYLHQDLRFVEKLMLLCVGLIGVGSSCSRSFHATLLYPMQLLDELPIYWLMLSCCHALFHREDTFSGKDQKKLSAKVSASILAGVGGGLSLVLLSTNQISHIHNIARGLMSTTFSMAFVYIFYSASVASHETVMRLQSIEKHPDKQSPVKNFTTAFFLFVAAIVSWLLDNFCCALLQNLPAGVPYPHLHALGWHLGTAVGLHLMFISIVFHYQVAKAEGGAVVELAVAFGIVPYVNVHDADSKKKQ